MVAWDIANDSTGNRLHLAPGTGLLLETIDRGSLRQYAGKVMGLAQDALAVELPQEAMEALWRGPGQGVVVSVRLDGQLYVFDSTLLGVDGAPHPSVRLRAPERVFRVERREYYRLAKLIRPRVAEVVGDGPDRSLSAVIADISGGGLQFLERRPVPVGSVVRMEIPLTSVDDILEARAEVVAVRKPEEGKSLYRISARFQDLPERDRRRLMQFIFQQQIELRKRGLA